MVTLLIFLAILAVLVLSHEFGHFVVARLCRMKVYEFGFGFPPRLFGVRRLKSKNGKTDKIRFVWGSKNIEHLAEESDFEHGTVYSFNLIPLGGFVKIKGEDGEETGPDSFGSRPAWQRALTLFAGVAMNVIVASVLLSAGFMIGMPQAVDDAGGGVKDRHVAIVQVMPGKPADLAGLKAGDFIIKIDSIDSPGLKQLQDYVNANRDKDIHVVATRDGQTISRDIHPFVYPDTGKAGFGIAIEEVGIVTYPWFKAIYFGIIATGSYTKQIVLAFYYLIKGLFAGAAVGEALSGPVGIAVMTGQVARLGFAYLLNFTALLSINLAIVNILPIPALDGGRLLFLGIGKLTRRPVTPRHEQLAHTIGFILLMILVVIITAKDLNTFRGAILGFFQRVF